MLWLGGVISFKMVVRNAETVVSYFSLAFVLLMRMLRYHCVSFIGIA